MLLPADDTTSLVRLYHLNSEPWFPHFATAPVFEPEFVALGDPDAAIRLPEPSAESPVLAAIRQRQSCRRFRPEPLPLATLSALLRGVYALTRLDHGPTGVALTRSVPSAGALYPLELRVLLQRTPDLADGLYYYNVRDHALAPLRLAASFADLGRCLVDQRYFANANAVLIFSAVLARTLRKYGARGYRYSLLEAGHAAQNAVLLATEAGLGSLVVGAFFDHQLNRWLDVDGYHEVALYCVGIGWPAE